MNANPDQAKQAASQLPWPMIAILGPTASGKSALGVALAERFGGEILVCDSTQVYRGFDIGTGKPAMEERHGIPHHLMDVVEPGRRFTAGAYRTNAIAALEDIRSRARLPIFTVGTGLYFRALVEGLANAPGRSEKIRSRLESLAETRGTPHLHEVLQRLDPAAASRIAPRDRQKLIRAIEVCVLAGRPLTEIHESGRKRLEGFSLLKIGLQPPRAGLYARIERRVQTMLDRGWLDEVSSLLRASGSANAKPFEFIGYRELKAHLEGIVTLEAARKAVTQATRRYAKRQLTWFRKEPAVHWLEGFGDDPAIMESAAALVRQTLASNAAHTAACGSPNS